MLKKYIIKYRLLCETGIRIGASNNSFDIGGIDNPVIKNPLTGEPYIPGSSLKGKMRSLLEWFEYPEAVIKNEGKVLNDSNYDVCKIFGLAPSSDKNTDENVKVTRVIVRDAFLTDESKKKLQEELGNNIFTEIKAENSINRLTSRANPRFFERVPKGAEFEGEIIFTVYKEEDEKLLNKLYVAMKLLEDNYLGGSGSRGSGEVKFIKIKEIIRDREYYFGRKEEETRDINLNEITVE
ncbi:type III-A CRISPR-associated RAMP protein Csm3 [Thermohalobacter berrensis]|uniref:CRISPR system Cms endoribonuclease Csm3 n=1 Tax=Thermohalobacter berrensis TaxID=99594 RepID=A0A419T151_9FIRM|nr:type III-A CRISPR-associated RAMP protein Csm3 [Thermohalobacter berrensis]RKD31284.1 type III-A CRISPR-associated RAMP protein Csm3 [Thermohalobacter berrensis]